MNIMFKRTIVSNEDLVGAILQSWTSGWRFYQFGLIWFIVDEFCNGKQAQLRLYEILLMLSNSQQRK